MKWKYLFLIRRISRKIPSRKLRNLPIPCRVISLWPRMTCRIRSLSSRFERDRSIGKNMFILLLLPQLRRATLDLRLEMPTTKH